MIGVCWSTIIAGFVFFRFFLSGLKVAVDSKQVTMMMMGVWMTLIVIAIMMTTIVMVVVVVMV